MLGNVFSPFYKRAREREGAVSPLEHSTMNVAVYGREARAWALTERGAGAVSRERRALAIGPSSMRWDGGALVIDLDEVGAPLGRRIAGRVRLFPCDENPVRVDLDARGAHAWWPIAPHARAEVTLTHPALRFSGPAYLDANRGKEPIERAFRKWTWARGEVGGRTIVSYDVDRRDGTRLLFGGTFDAAGRVHERGGLAQHRLAGTRWRLDRAIAIDRAASPVIARTLEDTPFYARSVVRAELEGSSTSLVHESLDLDRFGASWVQALLPFRMRRAR